MKDNWIRMLYGLKECFFSADDIKPNIKIADHEKMILNPQSKSGFLNPRKLKWQQTRK